MTSKGGVRKAQSVTNMSNFDEVDSAIQGAGGRQRTNDDIIPDIVPILVEEHKGRDSGLGRWAHSMFDVSSERSSSVSTGSSSNLLQPPPATLTTTSNLINKRVRKISKLIPIKQFVGSLTALDKEGEQQQLLQEAGAREQKRKKKKKKPKTVEDYGESQAERNSGEHQEVEVSSTPGT